MSIKLDSFDKIRRYVKGVVYRATHHAGGVNQVIFALPSLLLVYCEAPMEAKEYEGAAKNIIWCQIGGKRYAFRYEHSSEQIEIREGRITGPILHIIDNQTSLQQLRDMFIQLNNGVNLENVDPEINF